MKQKPQWLEDNMLIAGRSKSGKSYHFEHTILPELIKNDWRQIFILDMKGQYKFGAVVPLAKIKDPMVLAKIATGQYTKDKNGKPKPPRIITIHAGMYDPDQVEMIFYYMNRNVNKIFVMEESAFYFEDLKSRILPPETKYYIRCSTGSHNLNNNMIMITQYPNDIPTVFLNMFDMGRIFYLPPKAVDYLCSKYFIADDREVVMKTISPLGCYRYYDIRRNVLESTDSPVLSDSSS